MANCNCNDFPISCAPHAPGGECHHHHGCPPHPCPPPDYKGGTSMYIGARYVPIFADPVEWDDEREYEPLTIVIKNGDCYTSKCYVPKGAPLPEYPESQTKYWVKTSDYNYQFADLKKTVLDLSRLVEQFQKDNEKFTELINGWNETVKEWTAKMEEWQDQMDDFKQAVADLTSKLDEEITRAKAAEKANKAAIDEEVSRAKAREDELQAACEASCAAEKKAREEADTAIRADFTAADTALGERIDTEATTREAADNDLKALIQQEETRATGEEGAIRNELAAAIAKEENARMAEDTALSNRITSNKTDIDAIKAEQVIQNTNISNNAKNIQDNAAEIAKHADRLTSLESNASDWDTVFPDTTIAQEVQKEELARANAETRLDAKDTQLAADIEEVRDLANHKVDQTTFTEADANNVKYVNTRAGVEIARSVALVSESSITREWLNANSALGTYNAKTPRDILFGKIPLSPFALKIESDAAQSAADKANTAIGSWETDHPGQTISECATSIENEVAAVDAKADANATNIGNWNTDHPGTTISEAVSALEDAAPNHALKTYQTRITAPATVSGSVYVDSDATSFDISVPLLFSDTPDSAKSIAGGNGTLRYAIIAASGNVVNTSSLSAAPWSVKVTNTSVVFTYSKVSISVSEPAIIAYQLTFGTPVSARVSFTRT